MEDQIRTVLLVCLLVHHRYVATVRLGLKLALDLLGLDTHLYLPCLNRLLN
jgi:hypothetical protein